MTAYIIRRLLAMIPALLGIATITFLLMHLTPGGPFASEHSDPMVRAAQLRAYGLDKPVWPTFLGPNSDLWKILVLALAVVSLVAGIFLAVRKIARETPLPGTLIGVGLVLGIWYVLMITEAPGSAPDQGFVPGQFLQFLGNLLRGDLGVSFTFRGQRVNDFLAQGARNSFFLGVAAFILLVGMALPLGVIAALRQNTWIDYVATSLSLIGYSIPNFGGRKCLIIFLGPVRRCSTTSAAHSCKSAWSICSIALTKVTA